VIGYWAKKCDPNAPKKKTKKKKNGKEIEVEECDDPCSCIDDDKVNSYPWRGEADYGLPPTKGTGPDDKSRNSNSFVSYFMNKCGFPREQMTAANKRYGMILPGFLQGWIDAGR